MELKEEFVKEFGINPDDLRIDQRLSIECLVSVMREVIMSEKPVALSVFYIAEEDLLKERPVFIYSALTKKLNKKLVIHAYDRVITKNKLKD